MSVLFIGSILVLILLFSKLTEIRDFPSLALPVVLIMMLYLETHNIDKEFAIIAIVLILPLFVFNKNVQKYAKKLNGLIYLSSTMVVALSIFLFTTKSDESLIFLEGIGGKEILTAIESEALLISILGTSIIVFFEMLYMRSKQWK